MKCLQDKNTIETLLAVNTLLLISCIATGLIEYLFEIPDFHQFHITFTEMLLILLYSVGFYSIFHFIIAIFTDIIILQSFYINNKKKYYFYISTIIFTLLNFIPFNITLTYILLGIVDSSSAIEVISLILSFIVATIIGKMITNSYADFVKISEKNSRFIIAFFVVIITCTFTITRKMFFSEKLLITYYLFLILIFVIFTVLCLSIRFKSVFSGKIKYEYAIIPIIIVIIATGFLFPQDKKVIAFVKKNMIFENNIIHIVSKLIDFDRDDSGPNFLVAENDFDNFNPKINVLAKDIPDNAIDENCFHGDLNIMSLYEYRKPPGLPIRFKGYNVLLLTINNLDFKQLMKNDESFLPSFLTQGVFFTESYMSSGNKILALNGILNANLVGIKELTRKPPIHPYGPSFFSALAENDYSSYVFLDIPYSATQDFFNLIGQVDSFYANDFSMKYPVSVSKIIDQLDADAKNPFFCWVYIDSRIPVNLNDRIKSIIDGIISLEKLDKTIVIIVLIPETDTDLAPSRVVNAPVFIYYTNITPKTITQKVSNLDILPSLLTMLEINYDHKGYLGHDISQYLFSDNYKNHPVFSIDPQAGVAVALQENYKLIYNITDHYQEIYNILSDPQERQNLINRGNNQFDEILTSMDFFMSTGSKE